MALWVAALLGLVQGTFMFVPVSSTSHLALTQHWLEGQGHLAASPESAEMLLLDLVLHTGTVVSIALVFRRQLATLGRDVVAEWRIRRSHPTEAAPAGRLVAMLGFVVAAVVGAVALTLVLRLLYAAKFRVFSIYVGLVAIAVLIIGDPATAPA